MRRKILAILSVVMFIWGISKLSFAQIYTEPVYNVTGISQEPVSEETGNVENEICPVSGEKIKEETKVVYEYNGKAYNLCCAACIDEFKKDPEKYIKKVEQELKAESPKKQRGQHLRRKLRQKR